MRDIARTKAQLIDELAAMRQRISELETTVGECKRIEEALRESEARYRDLVEREKDIIYTLDAVGNVTSANSAVSLLGYRPEQVVGKHFTELMAEEQREETMEDFNHLLKTGEVVAETVLLDTKGEPHFVEYSSTVIEQDGKVVGTRGIVRDITERKQAEEARLAAVKTVSDVVEAIPDALAMLDIDGNLVHINSACATMFGLEPEEVVGKNTMELPTMIPEDAEKGVQLMKEALETGESKAVDMMVYTKGGKQFPISAHGAIVRDAQGNPMYYVSIMRDITERKRSEEALRESEERFRALIENALDAIVILNSDGTIRYQSPAMERMTGRKAKVRIGRDPLEFSHPDDTPHVIEAFAQLLENRIATVRTESRLRHEDGSWRTFEVVGNNLLDNPAVAGIVLNLRDITERKRMQEKVLRSEGYFRSLIENSTEAIAIVNGEGLLTYESPSFERLLGFKGKDHIGTSPFEHVHRDDRSRVANAFAELTQNPGAIARDELRVWHRNGSLHNVEVIGRNLLNDPAVGGIVANIRDITERKRAEEALRREEEYFRALIENSLDFVCVLNSDGTVRYESPSVERVQGYKPEERIGQTPVELIHPEDMAEAADLLAHMLENPGTTLRVQLRFRHKDGSWRVLDAVAQNLLDNPAVAGIVANLRDVTEQKRAEEALRESEHNYRLLFESTIDGTVVIDAETMKVVLANQTAAKMYGFASMEEVVEANLLDYIHPDDRDRALKTIAEDLFEKDLRRTEEFRTVTKDGREIWIAGVGTRVEYQGRLAGLISFRDITEHKRTDERLRELYEQERESRQRVEAEMKRRVEFTRALAHELKNPLTSVLASSDLLASEVHDEPLLSLARNIGQGASSLNSRIDELLDLARGEVGMLQLKLDSVDLLQLLRETGESMRPLTSSRGQSLTLDLPPSLPPVRADAARVQQVVTNLLGNAFKFTPVAGSITLRAKEKDAALVVEVRDTGRGMSKEEQKHLFEPYHRLHSEPSGGLGLGLALCKTLVELHGGQIWVRSNVGRGSTFVFSLPLEAAEGQAVELEKPAKLWKVLIIEDDQEIVSSVSVAFRMRWPEAELISSSLGEEGLELVETENPDLVILDLGLPDISGFEVLREIRLFSPVPVVILTVKADEADMVKGLEWGADDYVVKPFRQLELLARLKVQLRKQIPPGEEAPIICGSLQLDPSTYQLTHGGREISLTIVEGRIMQYLMQNAGHVVTHSRLAEAVWEEDHAGAVDSLRVYIRYLREKLEEDPSQPQMILTKVGIGYSLAKPA